jgi:hypothetical protein
MAIETLYGSAVNMRFITGVRESSGTNVYRTVSLGRVNHEAKADDIMACVGEFLQVVGWPLYSVERRLNLRIEF